APAVYKQEGQFSANIYLEVSDDGGEIELWDYPPLHPSEIAADSKSDWRAALPESFLVTPKRADLILFNTRRPHAVRSFDKGRRITIQCFIGFRKGEPLSLWN